MTILLGTTSGQKLAIIQKFFSNKNLKADIIPIAVDSDIDDQPLNEELIIRGSINRARNAVKMRGEEYDFSIGLEGGMGKSNNVWHYVCVVSIIDIKGNVYSGTSRKNPIPYPVTQQIENGAYFATAIREFENEISDDNNELKELVFELINRTESFLEAFELAWVQCTNHSYFM